MLGDWAPPSSQKSGVELNLNRGRSQFTNFRTFRAQLVPNLKPLAGSRVDTGADDAAAVLGHEPLGLSPVEAGSALALDCVAVEVAVVRLAEGLRSRHGASEGESSSRTQGSAFAG